MATYQTSDGKQFDYQSEAKSHQMDVDYSWMVAQANAEATHQKMWMPLNEATELREECVAAVNGGEWESAFTKLKDMYWMLTSRNWNVAADELIKYVSEEVREKVRGYVEYERDLLPEHRKQLARASVLRRGEADVENIDWKVSDYQIAVAVYPFCNEKREEYVKTLASLHAMRGGMYKAGGHDNEAKAEYCVAMILDPDLRAQALEAFPELADAPHDEEFGAPPREIAAFKSPMRSLEVFEQPIYAPGDKVFAKYAGHPEYYLAEILYVNPNGEACVKFYDGLKSDYTRIYPFEKIARMYNLVANPHGGAKGKGECEIVKVNGPQVEVKFTETGKTETLGFEDLMFTTRKDGAQEGDLEQAEKADNGVNGVPTWIFKLVLVVVLGSLGGWIFGTWGSFAGIVIGYFSGGWVRKKLWEKL